MKKSFVVGLAAVLCLLVVPGVWADEPAEAPGLKIGVGGTFFGNLMGGTPGLDVYGQLPLGDTLSVRGNLTTLAAVQGIFLFLLEGTGIVQLGGDGFTPYFGGGGGLFMVVGQGMGQALPSFNLLGGAEMALGDQFGVYGQLKVMGFYVAPAFEFVYGPSVGLFIRL